MLNTGHTKPCTFVLFDLSAAVDASIWCCCGFVFYLFPVFSKQPAISGCFGQFGNGFRSISICRALLRFCTIFPISHVSVLLDTSCHTARIARLSSLFSVPETPGVLVLLGAGVFSSWGVRMPLYLGSSRPGREGGAVMVPCSSFLSSFSVCLSQLLALSASLYLTKPLKII